MKLFDAYNERELKARAKDPGSVDRAMYNLECKNYSDYYENPGDVDEGLWEKAKEASKEAYGVIKWPVTSYIYQKMGGKFSQK